MYIDQSMDSITVCGLHYWYRLVLRAVSVAPVIVYFAMSIERLLYQRRFMVVGVCLGISHSRGPGAFCSFRGCLKKLVWRPG